MDPRIRIRMRIHTKMSWIRNTDSHSPEVVRWAEVQLGALIVGDDPGEDRVLIEVVVGTACYGVEEHQILKVRDLASLPFGRHVRGSGCRKNCPIIQQSVEATKLLTKTRGWNHENFKQRSSVPDPNPDPPDPHFFGPPGSFYHQAKIVRKIWFLLFCDFSWNFYLWKMM